MTVLVFLLMISRIHSFTLRNRRLQWSQTRRFGRRRERDGSSANGSALEWETFDFSNSPKQDDRFASTVVASSDVEWQEIRESEAAEDEAVATALDAHHDAWERLDPDLVQQATEILAPYIQDSRIERMQSVLEQRTASVRALFENPSNPSNVWACLRTLDSFGIQHVDLIVQSGRYKGKAALSQKRGLRTAMGSARWLTLRNHGTTKEDVAALKQSSYLLVSEVGPEAVDIREVPWEQFQDKPICFVMGNEESGVSEEMKESADLLFTLPMCGFAESFNLSVATAITLAHLSAAGQIRNGNLPEQEVKCLMLKGIKNSFPKSDMARLLLEKDGIELPQDLNLL